MTVEEDWIKSYNKTKSLAVEMRAYAYKLAKKHGLSPLAMGNTDSEVFYFIVGLKSHRR
jgi:hypothetical protein